MPQSNDAGSRQPFITLTYNLSKPFPFRWFTIFIVVEFSIALIVFSLLSILTAGYEQVSFYTSDPNVTEARQLIPGLPSFLTSKSKPSCQSAEVEVGGSFSTNNSALTYTLNSVQQDASILSSLIYHNNRLEDCVVKDVLINIDCLDRTATQIAISNYSADLSSSIDCTVMSDSGRVILGLTATYIYIPSNVAVYDRFTVFPGRNKLTASSLFWGEEALALYWTYLTDTYQKYMHGHVEGYFEFTKGALYFTPNEDNKNDITSPAFFGGIERLISVDDNRTVYVSFNSQPDNITSLSGERYEWDVRQPFWMPADGLGKIFHSTIMTDLGQVDYQPNILTDPNLLQHFSQNFSYINTTVWNSGGLIRNAGRVQQDYETLKDTTGPLGVHASVISARYLCHVPRLKPVGSLIFSVVIADFVLLQVLWNVTMWIATLVTVRKVEKATWCEGCLKLEAELGEGNQTTSHRKGMSSSISMIGTTSEREGLVQTWI